MKQFIASILCACLLCMNIPTVHASSQESCDNSNCSIDNRVIINEPISENQAKFGEFISTTHGIDLNSNDVNVIYYDDGTAELTRKLSDESTEIYSSITEKQLNELQSTTYSTNPQPYSLVGSSILFGIVSVSKIVWKSGKVVSKVCKVIEKSGNGNPCSLVKNSFLESLKQPTSVKLEVAQTLYKDPSCPYPPHSLQCSQPPYGYVKTILKVVHH